MLCHQAANSLEFGALDLELLPYAVRLHSRRERSYQRKVRSLTRTSIGSLTCFRLQMACLRVGGIGVSASSEQRPRYRRSARWNADTPLRTHGFQCFNQKPVGSSGLSIADVGRGVGVELGRVWIFSNPGPGVAAGI